MTDTTPVAALRATWRSSAEHKAAQVKRFLGALGAVLAAQLVGDVSTGKNPLLHFTDVRTAWYYLIPFAYIAWRQIHPAMTASQLDTAPGAAIVPAQVGLPPAAPDVEAPDDTIDVESIPTDLSP